MKLIFFSFKYRHREKELNNFLKSRFYGDFFLLNLGGPFRYIIAKIFILLKIGKTISCDGKPLIKNKSFGINFWMRGTHLNIPTNLRDYDNNYVTISNPLLENNDKVFKIYPININKSQIKKKRQLIYISKIGNNISDENTNIWKKYKDLILNNFLLIDDINFWKEKFNKNSENKNFSTYNDLKLLLRNELIKKLKNKYNYKMRLIGSDWKKDIEDSENSIFDIRTVKKIYEGNICLDLGSSLGSNSLYSRSNQIIESGGLIIQSKQIDSSEIWKNESKDILFNNQKSLFEIIDKLFNDDSYSQKLLDEIYNNFNDSNYKIENSLKEIFN